MIAGIVLAAGASKRMGQPKQLMKVGQVTMLQHVVDAAVASRLNAIYVVLGLLAGEVQDSLAPREKVTFVRNPDYQEGIGSSVRAGVAALPAEADAAMFLLGDQPFIEKEVINELLAQSTPDNIVVPVVAGQRANPTVFGRAWFPDLLQVTGDSGGRTIIDAHPEVVVRVHVTADTRDMDTPADLRALT